MHQQPRGLSQEQQNQCRATLDRFIVKEEASGEFNVKLEIAPPPDSGLPDWPIHEIAAVDASFDVAAEVDCLLEAALEAMPAALNAR